MKIIFRTYNYPGFYRLPAPDESGGYTLCQEHSELYLEDNHIPFRGITEDTVLYDEEALPKYMAKVAVTWHHLIDYEIQKADMDDKMYSLARYYNQAVQMIYALSLYNLVTSSDIEYFAAAMHEVFPKLQYFATFEANEHLFGQKEGQPLNFDNIRYKYPILLNVFTLNDD